MVPVAEVSVGGEPPHDGRVLDVHLLEDGLRHVAVLGKHSDLTSALFTKGWNVEDVVTMREPRDGGCVKMQTGKRGVNKSANFADVM